MQDTEWETEVEGSLGRVTDPRLVPPQAAGTLGEDGRAWPCCRGHPTGEGALPLTRLPHATHDAYVDPFVSLSQSSAGRGAFSPSQRTPRRLGDVP